MSVATDNASGDVYVLDSNDNVVDVFDSTGAYLCQITGAATPSASECNGAAGSDTPVHGFSTPTAIAVDQATGDVYVLDPANAVVDIFTSAGAYSGNQIALSQIPNGFTTLSRGLAVNSANGHVYVADSGPVVIDEFDASGSYVQTWDGTNTPAGSFGVQYLSVATGDASGQVYVTDTTDTVTDAFDSSGAYIGQFGHSYAQAPGAPATAVDDATGEIYVADNASPSLVDVFAAAVVVPTVATDPATNVGPTSATLDGTVNPSGLQASDCHFDYVDDADFDPTRANPYAFGQAAPCVPGAGSIPADSSDHAVSADVSGLSAGTTYHFRLVASNANGTSDGADQTFGTLPPPSITSAKVTSLTPTSAELTAQINPNGFDTTCEFDYGTSAAYGTTVPCDPTDLGAGTADVARSVELAGLSGNTTYHWRVVVTSANGSAGAGTDHTFIYDTTAQALPDNRAYEMVTPPQKNGALIGNYGLADVAEGGSRVIAMSLQCFADAVSCVAQRGSGVATPYEFTRSTTGWTATAMAPAASAVPESTSWDYRASSGAALFSGATESSGKDDLFVRQPSGAFTLLGPVTPASDPRLGPVGGSPGGQNQAMTADLSRIAYGSNPVASGAPATVYEYTRPDPAGPLRVDVSGGEGSTDAVSSCGAYLGAQNTGQPGELSRDGRTVFFTTIGGPSCTGTGADAATPHPTYELFARIDGDGPGAHTVALSARSPADCTGPCAASTPRDAHFEAGADDGSIVTFTSPQQLTDDAAQDPSSSDSPATARCSDTTSANGCNLYVYDFGNPAGHELVDASAGDSSGDGPHVLGVIAVSNDGSRAFFVAKGLLTTTPNAEGERARAGADNLYVFSRSSGALHGALRFIARLPSSDHGEWDSGGHSANVTPDGRYFVFLSHGRLTADDSSLSRAQQVFRYDAQTGDLIRISVGNNGYNDDGNRPEPTPCGLTGCSEDAWFATPARDRRDPTMSHDGAYIFFQSPVGLAPHAFDDVQITASDSGVPGYAENVYEWHAGHVYLIAGGTDATLNASPGPDCPFGIGASSSAVCLLGSDARGANVFFETTAALVPQDQDTANDYYDARVCTDADPCIQPPAPVAQCDGDACHGGAQNAPDVPGGGTVDFFGAPNPRTPAGRSARPRVRMVRHVVRGSSVLVTLRVPAAGHLRVSARGARTVRRSVPRAGTYRVAVVLTPRARLLARRRHRLQLRIVATFAPHGGKPSSATLRLSLRP